MIPLPFDNSYARLPDRFFARVTPTAVRAPRLIHLNRPLSRDLGLDADWLASDAGVPSLAGNRVPEGATPIATAYAGHQFGSFVPQLGDGRAILLGEVIDRSGVRRDIQLKGAGQTPFSRRGDGRAAIGPVLREYLVSEAMAALGIPTTRSLAVVTTGEAVRRESMLPGAILTRVASSHIRVGTFEYFAVRNDTEAVRLLADHVIARHYPDCAGADQPYRALLAAVVRAQAELIARWLTVGFIHGVMNTDNVAVSGETLDYGPCAFMDAYDPAAVFSSIDRAGRYAYGRQPAIGEWNMTRLAACLLPLLDDDEAAAVDAANEALESYASTFERAYRTGFRSKIGLTAERANDDVLIAELLEVMATNGADFTRTFRGLSDAAGMDGSAAAAEDELRALFREPAAFDGWATRWHQRLGEESVAAAARRDAMRAVNPAFIPRNHRVEEVIQAAITNDDYTPFVELLGVLAKPYESQPGMERYAAPPLPHERVMATFCGT